MTKKKRLKPGPRGTHGGYVFLQSGLIPEENSHVERYLTEVRAGYISELGPSEEGLSTGQLVLLGQLITCIGFTRLVEERAKKEKDLRYLCTKHYMQYMKQARQLVLDLGLKPEGVEEDPFEYIQQYDERKEKKKEEKAKNGDNKES